MKDPNKKVEEVSKSIWKKLIESDSQESSKRFLALYVVLVIGTAITMYSMWKGVDFITLLITWLSFAGSLLGLSAWQANRKKKHEADVEKVKASAQPTVQNEEGID